MRASPPTAEATSESPSASNQSSNSSASRSNRARISSDPCPMWSSCPRKVSSSPLVRPYRRFSCPWRDSLHPVSPFLMALCNMMASST